MKINRRKFVAISSATIAGASLAGPKAHAEYSALESLRVAVVGFGGRGKKLISAINSSKNAHIVAYADVDKNILNQQDPENNKAVREQDFRKLLDRKDVDVVVSAAPNHWHALITVVALQAGKHVYIEKPISHNMFESNTVVAAADKYKKIVQCGFQNRSDTSVFPFFKRLQTGEFGKVTSVHGTCHRPRQSIGKRKAPLKIPGEINYQMWLGPAADQPVLRTRLHYDWHWDFNTGNGDVGNQGPHEWDMMNWALGDTVDLPTTMKAAGNRFGWNDAGDTPNVMAVSGIMADTPFRFEVMDLKPGVKPPHDCRVGVIVETDKGRFVGGRHGGTFTWNDGKQESFKRRPEQDPTFDHMQNFIDGVFSGDRSKLNSDCAVAAKSSSMAHMANISFQLGEQCSGTEFKKRFAASDVEQELVQRMINAPKIYDKKHGSTSQDWIVGPTLSYDNATGKFTGASADGANQKMTRQYRSGFELPKV